MKKSNHLLFISLFMLTSCSANAYTSTTFTSGGLDYEVIASEQTAFSATHSQDNKVTKGVKVQNEDLNINGLVSGSIILKTIFSDALPFDEPDMSKKRLGGGIWIIQYPEGTDLSKKLNWLQQQDGVKKAEIEVVNNLLKPN
ncbi:MULTISPECIES: hypothetical protein [unclassified Photobacterium]|uniref:hypothetical protein n=1 Tax=unclassified Photobacterium TaxID=2628852 RepID=UPI001EDE13A6|nr:MULTISPECIES: hypothetical protein [unclassified Photobacterium]MCG3863471.1 hypothetical protein [Photobacterium sp. Ph6]MCG3875000.1 hypothetical protein [Photobacterium sp. Ph5]